MYGYFSLDLGRGGGVANDVSILGQGLPEHLAENGVIFHDQQSHRVQTRGHGVWWAPKEARSGGLDLSRWNRVLARGARS